MNDGTSTAIKRIVVGLDGSRASGAALGWAIDLARGMGSEVIAVHAIDLPAPYSQPYVAPVKVNEEWRRRVRAEFEDVWCAPLRVAGIRHRMVMDDGRAASVIRRVANSNSADIIVVGRRGRSESAEVILGSVSHDLVLRSTIPVLVIEPEPAARGKRKHRAA
ncbi:MAG TPA: universal stress protein [Candidatus Dormibacteraeota bacterium]|nr:universal stress protein [Candidatus Dormibacteraeota bacterium]